ncbi:DUF3291 domain-containing protein [Lysinibacillus sphaericus]
MALVSIYTVGRLLNPYDHPVSREFYELGYKVMHQAYASGHLIKELSSDGVPIPEEAKGEGYPVLTLTVWKSLHSLFRFTYAGKHSQALRNRNKWMEPDQGIHLSYVMWWTERAGDVTWEEAFNRYCHFIQHGATPFAFDFKHTFDDQGEVVKIKET